MAKNIDLDDRLSVTGIEAQGLIKDSIKRKNVLLSLPGHIQAAATPRLQLRGGQPSGQQAVTRVA